MAQSTSMEFNDREILILYKPQEKKDHNTYVMAKQISNHIHEIDVLKQKLTPTQLKEIIDKLGVKVEDIIERESEVYNEVYKDKAFDEAGWIDILIQNPDLLKTPIVFKGKRGLVIQTPSNVLSLEEDPSSNKVDK